MRDVNKFKGCLVGGAIGDALGYPVEFDTISVIREKYGDAGITRYKLENGIAQISDDTQMTLFTATGLLYGITRGKMRGIMAPITAYINSSYRNWLATQIKEYPWNHSDEKRPGLSISLRCMHQENRDEPAFPLCIMAATEELTSQLTTAGAAEALCVWPQSVSIILTMTTAPSNTLIW